jgi:hypothetical protein
LNIFSCLSGICPLFLKIHPTYGMNISGIDIILIL